MTGPAGHAVNHEELHKFSGDLGNYKNQSDQIGKLIHEADVGDKSWGVVGLFTKQQYTSTLDSLVGHVREMTEGFGTLSDKIKTAADGYKGDDDKIKDTFKQILDGLNGKGDASGGSSGAGPIGGGFNGPNIDLGMETGAPGGSPSGSGPSTPGGSAGPSTPVCRFHRNQTMTVAKKRIRLTRACPCLKNQPRANRKGTRSTRACPSPPIRARLATSPDG